MRRLIATVAALAALGAVPAQAQTGASQLDLDLTMAPSKTGTPEHPRGIRLVGELRFPVSTHGFVERFERGMILLPRGIVFNGSAYPRCRVQVLRRKGPTGCPKASLVGRAGDWPGPRNPPDDRADPRVVFVNGGKTLWAYLVIRQPALVKEAVLVPVEEAPFGPWGPRIGFHMPQMWSIIGEPLRTPPKVHFSIGRTRGAPELFTSARRCPGKGFFAYEVRASFSRRDGGSVDRRRRGRLACR